MLLRSLPQRHHRCVRDSGFVTAEFVLITPALILLLFLGVVLGRVVVADSGLNTAAHAAARAASLERTHHSAISAAENTAASMTPDECDSHSAAIDTGGLQRGGTVTVTLTCTVTTNAVGQVHLASLTATASAPIDQWRGEAKA